MRLARFSAALALLLSPTLLAARDRAADPVDVATALSFVALGR